MRRIKKIVIHHSASRDTEGMNFAGILAWHVKGRGFSNIAYHRILEEVGKTIVVIEGRPLTRVGAHAKGANFDSIGVCVVGHDKFSPAMIRRLRIVVDELCAVFKLPTSKVFCHSEVGTTRTVCPGETLTKWVKRYRS